MKVKIYVKNIKEIEELIEYLDFDFVQHQSQKNPSPNYIKDTEFIVSCKYPRSIVAEYKGYYLPLGYPSFDNRKLEALPLNAFLNPEDYLNILYSLSLLLYY